MTERTIVLRFVDADSGKLLGEHAATESQVPESFDVATTLDIGQVRFEVVHAEPATRSAASAQGFMTLRLRRVDIRMVDPKELLCSLPSIANELPPIAEGSTTAGKSVLTIHEDDWRQVELLSPAAAELAASDLAAIADIHRTERVGSGFRKLHVRKNVTEPLLGLELRLESLTGEVWCDHRTYQGLAFAGVEGVVADGFAVRLPGGTIAYGRAPNGILREVGLIREAGVPRPRDKMGELAFWIQKRNLLLVDWCRIRTAGEVLDINALEWDCWPVAGQSPGRIFLGLPRESLP